jgi:hypothetical protein
MPDNLNIAAKRQGLYANIASHAGSGKRRSPDSSYLKRHGALKKFGDHRSSNLITR